MRSTANKISAAATATLSLLLTPVVPVSNAYADAGRVTILRTHDPETHAPGILVTYSWDSRFARKFSARVRLLQDGRLVGRITFLPGWQSAPAFFRTTATPRLHTFQAVGALLHKDGSKVLGSTQRSPRKQWRAKVQPGQITGMKVTSWPHGR